ncbi:uncharacterized protein [Primulina huaijiensis]|uniref:uncharacterized protein isoform X1 n=1 Tax=Primulina huaijiensis TaxID=1492673 RepID=UPI003CC78973
MHTWGKGDDSYQRRFSNGSMCLFLPVVSCIDTAQPRRSLSYDKLPPEPISLTVLKLDGSSFGIKLAKTGTVGELKLAVEAAFDHLPKKGPTKVSWAHVWGQFCLCHDGRKLLIDSDYIRMCGIQDGDQLQFARHASNYDNLVTVFDKDDSDSDYELNSYGYKGRQQNGEKNNVNGGQNVANVELESGVHSQCEHKITHMLRGLFSYRKLHGAPMRIGDGTIFSKFSNRGLGSLRKVIRSYNSKYDSQT